MSPLRVEILAYAPTAFFQCRHCEVVTSEAGLGRCVREDQLQNGLPVDLQRELARVVAWAARLMASHGHRVEVEVIDAASVRCLGNRCDTVSGAIRRSSWAGASDSGAPTSLPRRARWRSAWRRPQRPERGP